MCYPVEPRDIYMKSIYLYIYKGYWFLSFAKHIGKNLYSEYSQNLFYSAERSGVTKFETDAIKMYFKKSNSKNIRSNR